MKKEKKKKKKTRNKHDHGSTSSSTRFWIGTFFPRSVYSPSVAAYVGLYPINVLVCSQWHHPHWGLPSVHDATSGHFSSYPSNLVSSSQSFIQLYKSILHTVIQVVWSFMHSYIHAYTTYRQHHSYMVALTTLSLFSPSGSSLTNSLSIFLSSLLSSVASSATTRAAGIYLCFMSSVASSATTQLAFTFVSSRRWQVRQQPEQLTFIPNEIMLSLIKSDPVSLTDSSPLLFCYPQPSHLYCIAFILTSRAFTTLHAKHHMHSIAFTSILQLKSVKNGVLYI